MTDTRSDIEVAHELVQSAVGGALATLLISYTIQLILEGEGAGSRHMIQTGSRFTLSGPGGDQVVDVEANPASTVPFLSLLRRTTVTAIAVTEPANLHVEFDTGHAFDIEVDEAYEAWEVHGPDGLFVVASPGGDVAVWEPGGGNVARGGKGTIHRISED